MKHTLSVLVENKPGVLSRIAGLFARRGFNIDSLAVGITENPDVSRMTITVDGKDHPIEQVTKQLHKLINVIKITDLDPKRTVARELALVKVKSDAHSRGEIMQIAEIFRANILDVGRKTITLEITGTYEKINAIEQLLEPHGIVEIVRTGRIAIERGAK
ncbi:MAG: acetolactate synthase small subunit [Gaiellales bacterium]|nr:MAG: acetolactate synthase small subunit [Gaiellales bacterium]